MEYLMVKNKFSLAIIISLFLILGIVSHVVPDEVVMRSVTAPTINWSRQEDPVIFHGSQLPLFSGVDVSRLYAYSFAGGVWEQIPFQIDEVIAVGQYGDEGGLLDDDDELVFMAMDLGEMAVSGNWIDDTSSRISPRYQLEVTNPLNTAEVGYVYVFQSDTLTNTHVDYVDWISETQVIDAGAYKLGITTSPLQREDSLELNDTGVDILDRSKFKLNVVCRAGGVPVPITLNEDAFEGEMEDFFIFEPTIDGPVRVGGSTLGWINWSYYSMRFNQFGLNFDYLTGLVCETGLLNFGRFDGFRFLFDWIDPDASGMSPMTYYDSNKTSGSPIDGSDDFVSTSPLTKWTQVSGNLGSVVRLTDLGDGVVGAYLNYYKDDSATDYEDTGDWQSYGDSGFEILFEQGQTEYGQLDVEMVEYFLDPNQPKIGDTYLGCKENPLDEDDMVISSQEYEVVYFFPLVISSNIPD
jgi:hypothetical protein